MAKHVGVTHKTVVAHRAQLGNSQVTARKAITKHGTETVVDTSKVGQGRMSLVESASDPVSAITSGALCCKVR